MGELVAGAAKKSAEEEEFAVKKSEKIKVRAEEASSAPIFFDSPLRWRVLLPARYHVCGNRNGVSESGETRKTTGSPSPYTARPPKSVKGR